MVNANTRKNTANKRMFGKITSTANLLYQIYTHTHTADFEILWCVNPFVFIQVTVKQSVYTQPGFWWGNLRERGHLEDPGVNRRIILRWIFRKWDVRAWTGSM
jgi:hypothetical protein